MSHSFYYNLINILVIRAVVLGMGDGSMMTLSIADPEKKGISDYLKSLPSRNPAGCPSGPIPGIGSGYIQADWSNLIGRDPSRYCALIG